MEPGSPGRFHVKLLAALWVTTLWGPIGSSGRALRLSGWEVGGYAVGFQ